MDPKLYRHPELQRTKIKAARAAIALQEENLPVRNGNPKTRGGSL